jgi:hypothetical protein
LFYSAFIVVKDLKVFYLFILFIDFDDYVRAVEGATATLSCPAGNIIVQEKITFGNGYSSQTCSDPDAANKLAPYCAFKQTCTITADRNLFTESTCDPSITEYFQARWWCRPGMFLEQKSIKGLSNGIDKKMIIFNNIFI